MSDCIDRQTLINLLTSRAETLRGLYGDLGGAASGVRKLVQTLPSVEPKERTTRVECIAEVYKAEIVDHYLSGICGICGENTYDRAKYCFECGAKLDWNGNE